MNVPPAVEFDVAIVLGAQVLPDGRPSPALARRVAHAVALARSDLVGTLLMSGGPVSHPIPEAHVMRDLAIAAGIAPHRIHVEDRSRDTIANARLSVPIVVGQDWRRVLVVTDSFHLPRALYIFRRAGLTVTGFPARPQRPGPEWWLAHAREALAFIKTVYRLDIARS
jgi:uncharacterized SAM-binding protein YcdF (DUF218 family)